MATFTSFETVIKMQLDKIAETDVLFAKTYAKKNKSIKECCEYIMAEAKKAAKGKASIACDGDEVINLAMHYYDEDDIKAPSEKVAAEVVVASSATPEEKPKAKRKRTQKAKPVVEVAADDDTDENYELIIPVF